jgi:2,3-bisphosphoglycerate-dependent phosphoglycerate mutase
VEGAYSPYIMALTIFNRQINIKQFCRTLTELADDKQPVSISELYIMKKIFTLGGNIMTMIGIIRHGSTPWNKEGRAQGNSDIPLDADGCYQAEKLADRLQEEEWDVIYSSHLLRAKQTAEIIANKLGLPVNLDDRLREASGGQIEGTTEEERITKWGSNWRDLDLGIESNTSVITRGMSIINELTEKHPNKNILIVSHGSFIRQLLEKLAPAVTEVKRLENTSLTKLRMADSGWERELYNCTKHLLEK